MKKRIIALMLAVITVFGMLSIPTSAATISDGSKTCSVQNGPYHRYLSTTAGNTVGGGYRHYKTNDGITGPAYCIDWGLAMAPANKQLAISRYTSSPKTIGAFANGYPQRTLEEFLKLHLSDNPALKGLTEDEYAYATQVAVWATLGQLGVEGTSFTAGRATIAKPTNDAQKVRIYTALSIVLRLANGWDKQLYSGMYLRSEENALGATLEIQDGRSLEDAANSRLQGIQKETINGKEYYTRKFWAASATSTWPFDDKIGVWFSGAPTGTLVTDASNNVLPVKQLDKGGTVSLIPTEKKSTSLNVNGEEYSGVFKLCLPVDNVTEGGEIGINLYGTVSQYVIYLADNPSTKEQSYIIADPAYNNLTASGKFIWGPDEGRDTARISVMKVDGGNKPLAGAEFSLEGSDGSVYTGKTGPDGLIEWDGLDPDGSPFTLRETKAPEGYGIVDPINIKVTEGNTSYVTVRDDTDHSFRVKKIDAQNGYSLRGAVFRFEQIDGSFVTTGTTGHDGIIEFTGKELPFGSYRVSEEQAPAGYKKDTSVQTVEWDGTADVLLTFRDVREPTLIIYKVDSRGNSISGATFAVYQDGSLITTVECDDAGIARVSGLSEGYFEVEELTAPAGFVLDSTLHGIHLDPYDPAIDDDPSITIVNKAKCGLRIVKYDRVDHEPMQGVTFEVFCDAVSLGRFETSAEGEILLSDLRPGTYRAVEIDTGDDGHIRDVTAQEIELHADDDTRELIFFNDRLPGLHLIKVDSADLSTPISNAKFRFEAVDGSWGPEEMTSGPDGTIDLSKLPAGAVVVTELECPGYIVDEAQRIIYLHPNDTAQFVFTNSKRPTLRLIKTSADGTPLEGVTFRIAHVEDGTHYINRTTTSALLIVKKDAVTGKPLAGVEFLVTDSSGGVIGSSNGKYTTDSAGTVRVDGLTPGMTVITKEIRAKEGYLLDDTPQTVKIKANETVTLEFLNQPAGSLVIVKRDTLTGKPLEGVTFKVTTSTGEFVPDENGRLSSNGLYWTDKDGKITINGVVGSLVVTETKSIPGYSIDPGTQTQTVVVYPNDTQTLNFYNTPSTTLVIEKYIEGTTEPLKGVTFLVTDSSGAVVGQSNGEYITDEAGRIVITDLTPGITVTAREIKTVEGVILDGTPKSILIKEGEVQTLRFYNQRKGTLVVKKLDELTGKPLAGVEFQITYAEGGFVDDANGHLSSKGIYWTDFNGEIRISGVVGSLVVTETKCLPGYTIDPVARSQTVTINPADTQTLYFYNTKIGGLTIIKKDEETGERIKGVQFEVRRLNGEIIGTYTTDRNGVISLPQAEKGWYEIVERKQAEGYRLDDTPHRIEVKDGQTATLEITNRQAGSALIHKVDSLTGEGIYGVTFLISDAKGNPIGTYQSDSEGYVFIDKELADGKYTARELECAPGYILDTQPKTFYVKYGGCTTITWPNTAVRGQIQIIKKSADYNPTNGLPAGTLLEGATFEIYNERNGNKVDTIVTGANGLASSKQLPLGRYQIRETKAPSNYGASSETYTAVLEYSGQIVKLEITNKSLSTGVSIEKTGPKEATSGQPVRYVFSRIGNNSNVMLQSFYWRDTLPAAVRLDKVVTGTYNFPGTYKIVYKVNNAGDYRTLADSLSTSRNYSLAASPTALGLGANERVTEIMFVFGQVPGGFSQVEAPMLHCKAVSGLTPGSSFVNTADVGGTYNGVWVQAVTRWVTTVYGKPTPLPRTGY